MREWDGNGSDIKNRSQNLNATKGIKIPHKLSLHGVPITL